MHDKLTTHLSAAPGDYHAPCLVQRCPRSLWNTILFPLCLVFQSAYKSPLVMPAVSWKCGTVTLPLTVTCHCSMAALLGYTDPRPQMHTIDGKHTFPCPAIFRRAEASERSRFLSGLVPNDAAERDENDNGTYVHDVDTSAPSTPAAQAARQQPEPWQRQRRQSPVGTFSGGGSGGGTADAKVASWQQQLARRQATAAAERAANSAAAGGGAGGGTDDTSSSDEDAAGPRFAPRTPRRDDLPRSQTWATRQRAAPPATQPGWQSASPARGGSNAADWRADAELQAGSVREGPPRQAPPQSLLAQPRQQPRQQQKWSGSGGGGRSGGSGSGGRSGGGRLGVDRGGTAPDVVRSMRTTREERQQQRTRKGR